MLLHPLPQVTSWLYKGTPSSLQHTQQEGQAKKLSPLSYSSSASVIEVRISLSSLSKSLAGVLGMSLVFSSSFVRLCSDLI